VTPPPPPSWPPPPGSTPPPRRSSPLLPLLIVGAISVVMLMAGAAAAIMIVLMNSGAFSPVPPIRDTPPVAQAPPADSPPEPEAAPPGPERPDEASAPRRARQREADAVAPARPDRAATAERSRRDTPVDEPVERAVRVGGRIKAPTKTRNVQPVYPQIAQRARVQGVVIVEATIDPGGKVRETRLLRSIPLLDQAALDAVRQWEYEPTLLNGVAVPVIMTVTVNFTLQ
jgi:protein TonB